MGLGRSIKHAVKKVAKMATSMVKESVQGVINPVKFTKELINDPLGKITRTLGLDKLYSPKAPNINYQQNAQAEQRIDNNAEEQTAQDRARMLNRQAFQGSLPLMLLGQDFDADSVNLDRDSELGGKGQ